MNDNYKSDLVEEDDLQIEEIDEDNECIDILSVYRLPKEEMFVADKFVELITNISSEERQIDRDHLAALLKYVGKKIFEVRNKLGDQKDEIENQKLDLEHKLTFTHPDTEEWSHTLRAIGDTIIKRRRTKDTWTILSVISTNLNKSGNFILGMDKRAYTPRSNKYKEDTDMPKKQQNPTTMKFGNIKK